MYLTYENESNNYVYFDDLKVTYTKSQVVQSNNYYAFGLQTKDSWTRMDTKPNQYLYNAGSELNEATSSYDMMFRSYDPAIGRMSGVDPMVDKYASMTPYNYSMNDPIYYNDPSGAEYEWASMGGCGCWRDKGPQDGGGQSNGMYGSDSGMYGSGWNAATYGGGFVKYGPGDGGALHDHVNFILAGSHAARERRLNIQTGTAGLINNAWDATSDDSFAAYNIASGRLNQIFSADFSKFDGKLFSTPVILAGPGNLKSVQNVVTDIKSGQSLDQQLAIFFLYMINPSYGPEFLINDVLNWPDVEDMSWLPDAVNFARRVASWGHADQYFGDHDELRHSVGTFLVAERHGALWAKNITNANEYYGLARFDIPNLGERLSGNQPWAFEFRDFYYNNVGLVLWYTYSSYKMLK